MTTRIPTNIRSVPALTDVPVGTKISFKGLRTEFRYAKQDDGMWRETAPLIAGAENARVCGSEELNRTIDRTTHGGWAQVLQ